jgi:hypothetical protein
MLFLTTVTHVIFDGFCCKLLKRNRKKVANQIKFNR